MRTGRRLEEATQERQHAALHLSVRQALDLLGRLAGDQPDQHRFLGQPAEREELEAVTAQLVGDRHHPEHVGLLPRPQVGTMGGKVYGEGIFMPPLFVLYGQSLMKYARAHENDSTAHG